MGAGVIAVPQRPAMRYHGGKWLLAPWIIQHFPAHRIYAEPFGGAASVLLQKPRSYCEIYNDLDGEVVNLFTVLRHPRQAARLRRACVLTPFARVEFAAAYTPSDDPVEQARRTVVKAFMGYGSAGSSRRTGFRAWAREAGSTPAIDWKNWPEEVPRFAERMRGVTIEQSDAIELIQRIDGADTLFYVDPPYPLSTRGSGGTSAPHEYRHELTEDDHRALGKALNAAAGFVVLSGYACDLYDREIFADWHRVERETHAEGARDRTEVLWVSPRAADAMQGKHARMDWG